MRRELETKIMNSLFPYRKEIPFEDIRAQITIILSDYEITRRCTEVAIRDEDKNNMYLAMFLASKAAGGRTERTLHAYKNYLRKIFFTIGKNIDEITADDIKLYLAKRLRIDKTSKVSVDNERRALSTFYGWMLNNEHISKNPMNKVETMKISKPKKQAFTEMDIEKLRDACRTERESMIVEVLLSTWCRVSELCGIKIEEIDGDKVVVHGKGEKDRTVFLNAKAQLAIEKYLIKRNDDNHWLLPKRKELGVRPLTSKGAKREDACRWYENKEMIDGDLHCDKGTIESIVRNLGKRAGVKNAHPHRFRRTGATFALKTGMPFMTVSKLLGHANIAVTQVYLDISDEDLENEHSKFVR
ncbi:MAG: tyrosine-type recombinase/integrase [Butyrivibrio sp.]|nr:tyrosine-type recombinase/integrase [Butyrivibrio sp.]